MPWYTDGVEWFDCVDCGGLHFAVTAGGKIAFVELFDDPVVINPVDDLVERGEKTVLQATELESESTIDDLVERGEKTVLQATELESESTIDDESTDTWLHFFDVYLKDSPATFSAFVSGRRIISVTRFS